METLPEMVDVYSDKQPDFRDLPLPANTEWDIDLGLQTCEQYHEGILMNEKRCWLTEVERWAEMPREQKSDEIASIHSVFF